MVKAGNFEKTYQNLSFENTPKYHIFFVRAGNPHLKVSEKAPFDFVWIKYKLVFTCI